MATIWFMIVAVMVAVYVLLDGFDLGAGAVHLFIAKTDEERRTILRAIGPVWDGNEVWLLAAGGTLYFAFPLLYASSFSGFYLPLMMVLWLLMLRAIGIEFRTHIDDRLWKGFFDAIFGAGEHPAGHLLRSGAGQRGARRSAQCRRLLLRAAVDQLARGRAERHPRLVHRHLRRGCAGHAGRSRLSVSGDEDGRRTQPARAQGRFNVLAGAGPADDLQPDRNGLCRSARARKLQEVAHRIPGVRQS